MTTKTAPKPKMKDILEIAIGRESRRVDREAGIIYGVRVLGRESKKGRTYSDQAMGDAVRLYEGIPVYVDHPNRSAPDADRGMRDVFGELRSVRKDGDAIIADLHFLRSHEIAEQICESAERFPQKFGLSHNARGNIMRANGGYVVESIEEVRSVDIVSRPATNRGLFESEGYKVTKTIRSILEDCFPKTKANLVEMEGDMPMATAVDVPSEAGADEQIKAAFRSAVIAAFDDDSLDSAATLAKIKEILKAYDKLNGSEAKEEKPSDAPGGDASESVSGGSTATGNAILESIDKMAERIERMERDAMSRRVLESLSIDPASLDPERRKLLLAQDSESGMRTLVESWPAHVTRPTRTMPKRPRDEEPKQTSYPSTIKDFISSLR